MDLFRIFYTFVIRILYPKINDTIVFHVNINYVWLRVYDLALFLLCFFGQFYIIFFLPVKFVCILVLLFCHIFFSIEIQRHIPRMVCTYQSFAFPSVFLALICAQWLSKLFLYIYFCSFCSPFFVYFPFVVSRHHHHQSSNQSGRPIIKI